MLHIPYQWIELHGDRAGYDDPALVCGIGKMEGMSFMFIGHQKGRNTKENIYRNFAMPTPNGYALTMLWWVSESWLTDLKDHNLILFDYCLMFTFQWKGNLESESIFCDDVEQAAE